MVLCLTFTIWLFLMLTGLVVPDWNRTPQRQVELCIWGYSRLPVRNPVSLVRAGLLGDRLNLRVGRTAIFLSVGGGMYQNGDWIG